MIVNTSIRVAAHRRVVYRTVLRPGCLSGCLPGNPDVTGEPADGYDLVFTRGLGLLRMQIRGHVAVTGMTEDESLLLEGEGSHSRFGSIRLLCRLDFARAPRRTPQGPRPGTLLRGEVRAETGGLLAAMGERAMQEILERKTGQFFAALKQRVEHQVQTRNRAAAGRRPAAGMAAMRQRKGPQ